jgi:hypothetical protein
MIMWHHFFDLLGTFAIGWMTVDIIDFIRKIRSWKKC